MTDSNQELPNRGTTADRADLLSDAERQRDFDTKGTPINAKESAASEFRQQVASKQSNLDDFEPEESLWTGGFSPKAMVGSWLMIGIATVALLIALLIVALMIYLFTIPMALGLIVLIWIVGGCLYFWRRLGFHYQLTTQRFIHQTGIMTRKTDRIEVIDIDDVSYVQGPVQRAFGVGTIHLPGSDRTHPTLSMVGIDNVQEVAGLIDDVRRTERRKRSLHIESI